MTYSDVILAEPTLRHFWHLGANNTDLKGGVGLTYGSAVVRNVTGYAPEDTATVFDRNTNAYGTADPTAYAGAHSVEVLFSADPATMTNGWYIFGTRTAGGAILSTEWTLDPASNTTMRFALGNGSTSWSSSTLAAGLLRNVWHHAVLAIGSDGSWEIFLDRVSVGSGTWGITGTPTLFTATNKLTLAHYSRSFDVNWAFKGIMQNFAIYTSKLTLAQVQAHYDALPPRTYRLPLGDFPTAPREFFPLPVGGGGSGSGDRPLFGQLWPR
jgi:hypothetical protein